jgi:hypothetical protein
MPRGRKPQTGRALTGAERQSRYRQRHAGGQPTTPLRNPPVKLADRPPQRRRSRPPQRRRSRPQRWRAAAAELVALQAEYAAWLDALPEALHDSVTGQALQAIVDLDLDEICTIQPPRGFGRD